MDAPALRGVLLALALLAVSPVHADTPASCELPAGEADPLADREGMLAAYERMPTPCLRALFNACSAASSRNFLDFGSAAVCSFGYEALLKQGFGGNFRELLAWWQSQREPVTQ